MEERGKWAASDAEAEVGEDIQLIVPPEFEKPPYAMQCAVSSGPNEVILTFAYPLLSNPLGGHVTTYGTCARVVMAHNSALKLAHDIIQQLGPKK